MNSGLCETLRKLRLSGALSSLEVRLQEAMSHSLSHAEFLELVLQDELAVRADRQLERRVKAAMFRELKTLDNFDWAFNPSTPISAEGNSSILVRMSQALVQTNVNLTGRFPSHGMGTGSWSRTASRSTGL